MGVVWVGVDRETGQVTVGSPTVDVAGPVADWPEQAAAWIESLDAQALEDAAANELASLADSGAAVMLRVLARWVRGEA